MSLTYDCISTMERKANAQGKSRTDVENTK